MTLRVRAGIRAPGGILATLAVAAASLSAACSYFGGPEIICRQVDQVECQRMASELLERARRDHPEKRVVTITITGSGGVYDLRYSDGTGEAVVP